MFLKQLHSLAPERMVYVDESGFDDTLHYPYGYCHRSERFYGDIVGHRSERLSVVGAWRKGGEVIAPMVYQGYTNTQVFCQWFEEMLLPELIPGQIVILDNAGFHPRKRLEELLSGTGRQLWFLPPYSPDLNKIEKFWARLKKQVGKVLKECENLFDAIAQSLRLLS